MVMTSLLESFFRTQVLVHASLVDYDDMFPQRLNYGRNSSILQLLYYRSTCHHFLRSPRNTMLWYRYSSSANCMTHIKRNAWAKVNYIRTCEASIFCKLGKIYCLKMSSLDVYYTRLAYINLCRSWLHSRFVARRCCFALLLIAIYNNKLALHDK